MLLFSLDPRGADAYVITSLYGDLQHSPHDKLCRLLMFLATLREHGGQRVNVGGSNLAQARQVRQRAVGRQEAHVDQPVEGLACVSKAVFRPQIQARTMSLQSRQSQVDARRLFSRTSSRQ